MITQTTHTTTVTLGPDHKDVEVELLLDIAPAEPDVGILGAFIDNWAVIGVAGHTDTQSCLDIEQRILSEYDDDAFIQKLYEEGAADA